MTRSRSIDRSTLSPRDGTSRRGCWHRPGDLRHHPDVRRNDRTAGPVPAVLGGRIGLPRGVSRRGPCLGVLDRDLARHVGLDRATCLGHLAGLPGLRGLGAHERLVVLALDERLDPVEGDVVVDLDGRALHEVRAGRHEGAREAAVEAQLEAADGVGDDARAVGAVPDLELELGVERHVTERRALHPDVAPLAVLEPRHMVRRTDMDVVGVELVVEHRGDGVRLADLLGLEALPLEHVEEVGVAAEVELVCPVEPHAPVHEQPGEDAMADGRAHLALDVVADDGQPLPRRTGAASRARGR